MLKELLARSVDDKASIRLVVLGALPDLIRAAPDGSTEVAVVEAGAARVMDPEEKVGAGGWRQRHVCCMPQVLGWQLGAGAGWERSTGQLVTEAGIGWPHAAEAQHAVVLLPTLPPCSQADAWGDGAQMNGVMVHRWGDDAQIEHTMLVQMQPSSQPCVALLPCVIAATICGEPDTLCIAHIVMYDLAAPTRTGAHRCAQGAVRHLDSPPPPAGCPARPAGQLPAASEGQEEARAARGRGLPAGAVQGAG